MILRPTLAALFLLCAPLSAAGVGEGFSLPSTTGTRITPEALRGAPYLLFFGYTNCPDVCPMALSDLSFRIEELGTDAEALKVVFVTVDPGRDTIAHLREYLGYFDSRFIGLSGNAEETAEIAAAFRATYAKGEATGDYYTVDHTAAIYLMDSKGEYFGHVDYRAEPEEQLRALRALLDAEAAR